MTCLQEPTFVTAARVWTGTTRKMLADGAVLVRAGRIADVGPLARFREAANGVARVDLGDVTLLPGLIDAHVHLYGQNWDGRLLLAHGITTVRDVGNRFPAIVRLRKRQVAGRWCGPRIFACGPLLDADPPHWAHLARGLAADADVEAVVAELIAGGVDGLKTYVLAPPDLVGRVVRQAHRRGRRVSCHAGCTPVPEAIRLGIDCVEHVVTLGSAVLAPGADWHQLDVESRAVDELLRLFSDRGTWFDPTLGVMEGQQYWWGPHFEQTPGYELCPPHLRAWLRHDLAALADAYHWDAPRLAAAAEGFRRSQQLVRRFHEAGIPLVAGSDLPFVPPGRGLHYELELLAGAGIPNDAVLRMATVNAAAFLGAADHIGALRPGLDADLVAVAGDPLRDIGATRNVVAVWQNGRRLDPARLRGDAMRTLAAMPSTFDRACPPFGMEAGSVAALRGLTS